MFSGERDDINATTDRILKRCKAVDVVVNTPRSEEQTRALDEVNSLIQSVVQKMQDDLNVSKDVSSFRNAWFWETHILEARCWFAFMFFALIMSFNY